MTAVNEAGIILRNVGKGLLSIVIPAKKVNEPSEYLVLHYCKKCQRYHVAGNGLNVANQKPENGDKPNEYLGMHYCQICDRYHRTE
jgi:hypothetical protein